MFSVNFKTGRPRIAIPGMGDRIFSMTQDDEMVFSIPGQTILDAGCGNGCMSKEFSKLLNNTGKVYALDPSKELGRIFNFRKVKTQARYF
jgi:ubiquinone/menaquinone biosynthesis C-methylase UbiE